MKKTFYLNAILILCFCLIGCTNSDCPKNLRLIKNELSWDKVENATGYIVNINGVDEENIIEDTKYLIETIEGIGIYDVKVKTIFNNKTSKYSNIITYKVKAIKLDYPINIRSTDKTIAWDAVENALSYSILINNNRYISSENSYTLTDEQIGDAPLEIKISATGDDIFYADSDWSDSFFIGETKISTPSFAVMNIRNDVLNFNISSYTEKLVSYVLVSINDVFYKIENDDIVNGFSLEPYGDTGLTYLIKVKYCNDDINITDSDWSKEIFYAKNLSSPKNINISEQITLKNYLIITWEAVDQANSYHIFLNGKSYVSGVSSIYIHLEKGIYGDFSIKINAVSSSSSAYYFSSYSTAFYKGKEFLNAPTISFDESYQKIIFDIVEPLDNYVGIEFSINGVVIKIKLTYEDVKDGLSLNTIINDNENFAIKARLIGDNINFINYSDWSNTLRGIKDSQLDIPKNIMIDENNISWDKVQDADHYIIYTQQDNAEIIVYNVDTNNLVVSNEMGDNFFFCIVACGKSVIIRQGTEDYLYSHIDSEKSEYQYYGIKKLAKPVVKISLLSNILFVTLSINNNYNELYGNLNLLVNVNGIDYKLISKFSVSPSINNMTSIITFDDIDLDGKIIKLKFTGNDRGWPDSEWSIIINGELT